MARKRIYPDAPAGPFETPPVSFEDRRGRDIEIRAFDNDGDGSRNGGFEALLEMYLAFDQSDRAQGIPPSEEGPIRSWLDTILYGDCCNVVAWHGDDAVGHATLVPEDDKEAYELAIFVLQAYQRAGIGTHIMETLLGHGAENGVEYVWLTVERWNHAAIALYEKMGFETSNAENFEKEMSLTLSAAEE